MVYLQNSEKKTTCVRIEAQKGDYAMDLQLCAFTVMAICILGLGIMYSVYSSVLWWFL